MMAWMMKTHMVMDMDVVDKWRPIMVPLDIK